MKKTTIMLVTVLFMIIGYAAYNATVNIYGLGKISENISDFKVYLNNLKVNDKENTGINDAKDEFTIDNVKGNISIDIVNDSTEYDTESYLECVKNNIWDFDYTGSEQAFTVPVSGTYKLETWGAQGGDTAYTERGEVYRKGGYGAYAFGNYTATSKDVLYINVGGSGSSTLIDYTSNSEYCAINGGYNGGGNGFIENCIDGGSSGGGATHIATYSGILSSLSNKKSSILIVASGGGGSYAFRAYAANGGNGGGITGNTPGDLDNGGLCNKRTLTIGKKATQTASGTTSGCNIDNSATLAGFGYGASVDKSWGSGGGGGYYGGGAGMTAYGASGGSSYIGNTLLSEKSMYCNNCEESSEESTKTISTSCASSTATANCAKLGNGYARITLASNSKENISTDPITIEAQNKKTITLENINTGNMTCKLKVNKISRTEKAYTGPTEWTFDYTGEEQSFVVPTTGLYKLETWGAQGGSADSTHFGGYGGYSTGKIILNKNVRIYVSIGGKGNVDDDFDQSTYTKGGYNGGGDACGFKDKLASSGGGATHMSTSSGLLSELENNKENILIVSGAGGGGGYQKEGYEGSGGSGGGYSGVSGKYVINYQNLYISNGATQTNGGSFIQYDSYTYYASSFGSGGGAAKSKGNASGGGGGYYGGGLGNLFMGVGGGSGYIGNTLLTEKSMYCYNCTESSEESTKTISTTCTSETPTANCAKQGNGYAHITLIN